MAGITPAELAVLGGRLEAFAAEVLESLPRKDQRARGECYLRGLMLDGAASRSSRWPSAWARCTTRRCTTSLRPARGIGGRSAGGWPPGWSARWSRSRGRWMTPAFPKTATTRWGYSASTRARWARRPTASSGCRSTRSPSRPAARWTGGCLCPSPGMRPPWARGGRPATCPRTCGTGPSGSWRWICWMSWTSGTFGRRCWSATPATARWVSSARGWMIARSAMWCRSRPTPRPTPSRCARPRRRTRDGVADHSRATATSPARSSSWPWPPGSRRASS